ncbi:hypothetical protein AAFF_G00397410 [Aldrovandia affinis]|uniref:Uncharacterized protein n=1 Tax=Aldrovandia affinis TaxID=143900 RepID=A0AAD7SDC0_9TELE|nr:hypothetical protein AAFF_G00397410 [Aldrovandia affinis]
MANHRAVPPVPGKWRTALHSHKLKMNAEVVVWEEEQSRAASPASVDHPATSHMLRAVERVFRKEPKMPAYQHGEDIENYPLRFERIART